MIILPLSPWPLSHDILPLLPPSQTKEGNELKQEEKEMIFILSKEDE